MQSDCSEQNGLRTSLIRVIAGNTPSGAGFVTIRLISLSVPSSYQDLFVSDHVEDGKSIEASGKTVL